MFRLHILSTHTQICHASSADRSMGTTASAAPPPASESFHRNTVMDSRQPLSPAPFIHSNRAKSIITNKVAPVVITLNCKQEFQIHDDVIKTNYTMGCISDNMPEHFLVQGRYFMVMDVFNKADVLNTTASCGAPNFRQVRGGYPVFGMGQPSLGGFKQVLYTMQSQGHQEVIVFCVREEPVVFLRVGDDFIPYTPRKKENLHENLQGLSKNIHVEKLELNIRKELHDFARLSENTFYIYNDIEHFKDQPQKIIITCEEDIHITEEVYRRPVFTMPSYRYHRLPLPVEGAPLEEHFDAFVNILRETPSLRVRGGGASAPPTLLFSCQVGVGRTNMAMILGALVMERVMGNTQTSPSIPDEEESTPEVHFRVIETLISKLPEGQQVVDEVDRIVALCSEMHNVKDAIYENKKKLDAIAEDYQTQGNSTKLYFLQRLIQSLELYVYLILFNAYLHEQHSLAFSRSFSQWMCANAWVYRLLSHLDQSELRAPADLITRGARVLVADEFLAPDVLLTLKEMKVANFRRVSKMPIYGMAQPTAEALSVVLSYLADERRGYSVVLWVCVQDELVLECNGQMFYPREPTYLEQHISLYNALAQEIQELEHSLKEEVLGSQKWLEVTLEQEKQMKMFKSCRTLEEIFSSCKHTHKGLQYARIPLPECAAPREEDFDRLLEAMKSVLAEDCRAAFVFNCANGRSRSTTAMTIATLTLWHFKGFPEFGEEEIVSVPDAKYTKGEFEVVMRLIRLLPDGHRMKREVDIALDSVSETMTPMHHHLREIIICTYRQMKSCKSEQERGSLMLKSVQYLERYMYLILFNTYLHLEKKNSLQRSFSTWMHQVAARAGVYELLNQLTFSEFENQSESPFSRLRFRWREPTNRNLPYRGQML
ncbi:paladin isoform X2 [Silurus meridionalis]|uniref:paladin isoform X2 n=1 Tax=Silurus meridionalis TaxID=175797 RepID=UPI001EEA84AF|nr:paladin isoform X2 [Silurus meridionalis]